MAYDDRTNGTLSQINVTPLVDVMLVLLVIFMVTAPILQQGIAVDLPRVRGGTLAGDQKRLVVNVTNTGAVYLNDKAVTMAALRRRLVAVVREQPDRQVYLRADRRVPYGDVMAVLGTVKASGIQRLGMVTEPPTERR